MAVTADHGHDALVVVVERQVTSAISASMFLAAHCPDWSATEPSWGKDRPSGAGMLAKSPKSYPRPAGHCQVVLDVDPPTSALGEPGVAGQRRRHDPPPPDHAVGRNGGAVDSTARSSRTSLTDMPSRSSTPSRCRTAAAYSCALSENGPSTLWPRSARHHPGVPDGQVHQEILVRHDVADHLGQRARGLDPGGAGADDHEVERAPVHQRGSPSAASNRARIRERSRWASSSE